MNNNKKKLLNHTGTELNDKITVKTWKHTREIQAIQSHWNRYERQDNNDFFAFFAITIFFFFAITIIILHLNEQINSNVVVHSNQ